MCSCTYMFEFLQEPKPDLFVLDVGDIALEFVTLNTQEPVEVAGQLCTPACTCHQEAGQILVLVGEFKQTETHYNLSQACTHTHKQTKSIFCQIHS